MTRQESLLAQLYTLFAGQFPEHAELWRDLAREEKKHAIWLKQLYGAGEKGFILFDEGKIRISTMHIYIEHLEQTIARAGKRELTLAQAVAFTLDYERALMEKNVFTHFDSSSEKARGVLDRLALETESHIKEIQAISL